MASPFGISKRESTIEGRVVHELNRAVEKGNIREVISLALEQCRLSMERTHKKGLVEVDIEEYNDLFSNLQDKFTADLERDGISIPIPEVQFTDELNIAQGVGNAREVVSIILCQCHVCMHGVCTAIPSWRRRPSCKPRALPRNIARVYRSGSKCIYPDRARSERCRSLR